MVDVEEPSAAALGMSRVTAEEAVGLVRTDRPMPGEPPGSRWSDRSITTVLFVGVLAVYTAILRGKIEVYDTEAMLSVTKGIVNHGSLTAAGNGWKLTTRYAPYGIGISVLAIPSYALSKLTGSFPVLVSFVAPLLTAACVALLYRTSRALRWSAVHGLVAAVGFGLFSMAVWYTTELFSEPAITVCVLVIVLGLIRWKEGHRWAPLWIGIAAAAAIQFRSDSIFTVWITLLAIPFFVSWKEMRSRRPLALVIGPMAVSLVLLGWYNELRYHKVFISSYGPGSGFSTPIFHGLRGLLFSPGRSLFVFNPLTAVGLVGLVLLFFLPRVRNYPLGMVCTLAVVPRILFFAKWGIWDGAAVWGPRFLLPSVAVLSLTIVPVLRATSPRRLFGVLVRTAMGILAVFAAFVNALSAWVPLGAWLGALTNPYWQRRFGLHGIHGYVGASNALDFTFRGSEIWGYLTLLQHNVAPISPELWATGRPGFGYGLLAAGAVALAGAWWGAAMPKRKRALGQPIDDPDGLCVSL